MDNTSLSIAALSVDLHQAQTWQDIGIAVLDKALDTNSEMVEEAIDMVNLDPVRGHNIDISV